MKKSIIAILPFILAASCTKVVKLNLNNEAGQIVIQGSVTDSAGPYVVQITQSINFYASNTYPPVDGATVVITDSNAAISDTLTETAPGMYTTHTIQGKIGNTYLLYVQLKGKIYYSSSTMPGVVPLDSVTFDYATKNTIRAVANFADPKGIVNDYTFTVTVNGKSLNELHSFDDRLSDGRYQQEKMDNDTGDIKQGDVVRVDMYCIDANVFKYLDEAEQIAYKNDNLAAPANPTSNITGGCLGYFSAQSYTSKYSVPTK